MIANVTKLLSLLCIISQVHWMLFDDPQPLRAPKPPIQNPKRQVLLFTADWCPPCQADKRTLLPDLEQQGLTVGEDRRTADVLLVDADEFPEHVESWEVTVLPTYILVDTTGDVARELDRREGRLYDAERFVNFSKR